MSLSFRSLAQASMVAEDICVLPVPGGLLTRTNLCSPVMVIACRWTSFSPALWLAEFKSPPREVLRTCRVSPSTLVHVRQKR